MLCCPRNESDESERNAAARNAGKQHREARRAGSGVRWAGSGQPGTLYHRAGSGAQSESTPETQKVERGEFPGRVVVSSLEEDRQHVARGDNKLTGQRTSGGHGTASASWPSVEVWAASPRRRATGNWAFRPSLLFGRGRRAGEGPVRGQRCMAKGVFPGLNHVVPLEATACLRSPQGQTVANDCPPWEGA